MNTYQFFITNFKQILNNSYQIYIIYPLYTDNEFNRFNCPMYNIIYRI